MVAGAVVRTTTNPPQGKRSTTNTRGGGGGKGGGGTPKHYYGHKNKKRFYTAYLVVGLAAFYCAATMMEFSSSSVKWIALTNTYVDYYTTTTTTTSSGGSTSITPNDDDESPHDAAGQQQNATTTSLTSSWLRRASTTTTTATSSTTRNTTGEDGNKNNSSKKTAVASAGTTNNNNKKKLRRHHHHGNNNRTTVATSSAASTSSSTLASSSKGHHLGTVITSAIASTNIRHSDYTIFVGSLRKTGFQGRILIQIINDYPLHNKKFPIAYFKYRNVTDRIIVFRGGNVDENGGSSWCVKSSDPTLPIIRSNDDNEIPCTKVKDTKLPFSNRTYARYAMARDWLLSSNNVDDDGPVLYIDNIKGTFFQSNPFDDDIAATANLAGLQLYTYDESKTEEEDDTTSTKTTSTTGGGEGEGEEGDDEISKPIVLTSLNNRTAMHQTADPGEIIYDCTNTTTYDDKPLLNGNVVYASSQSDMIRYLGAMNTNVESWVLDVPQNKKESCISAPMSKSVSTTTTTKPNMISYRHEALHNYLYYSNQLSHTKATIIGNRDGHGLANSLQYMAEPILNAHFHQMQQKYQSKSRAKANSKPFDGSTWQRWFGCYYNNTGVGQMIRTTVAEEQPTYCNTYKNLVDERGYLLQQQQHEEHDGKTNSSDIIKLSPIVTHYNRFEELGSPNLEKWMLYSAGIIWDKKPVSFDRSMRKAMYDAGVTPQTKAATKSYDNKHRKEEARRKVTDTGIDLSDPELYKTASSTPSSSSSNSLHATVMSMATGYDLELYERFAGSLRKSGFQGKVLLAVDDEDLKFPEIQEYFKYRNVTAKTVEMIPPSECVETSDGFLHIVHNQTCSKQYPHLKATWARHSLFRDWLTECKTCTGPVLYIDSRDAYFQDDPFGPNTAPVTGLQVYQVGGGADTKISYVGDAIKQCKNQTFEEPMLCAGSTVGTRVAMLKYLEIMIKELELWISNPQCSFSDQGVHNYLYYSGQLPFATSQENWVDGIVNTVGYVAKGVVEEHSNMMYERYHHDKEANVTRETAHLLPYDGVNEDSDRWIGDRYHLVNDDGYFTQIDGKRVSPVIHQFDRFGKPGGQQLYDWMKNNSLWYDPMPASIFVPDMEPDDEAFSACLLVLDENHRLPEWLAYHYYTLPLRHLIVAIDPASKTDPDDIFNRWRPRMTIDSWSDEDFTDANLTKRDPADDIDTAIEKHRKRQRDFYAKCIRHHKERNRTWTAFTDADEFITISSDAFSPQVAQEKMKQPGSVLRMIKQLYNTTNSTMPTKWVDRFQKTGCAMIPRVLFTPVESKPEEIERGLPGGNGAVVNASQLETLRWRYRATPRYNGTNRDIDDWGKSLMDISIVKEKDFEKEGTAHFALHSLCKRSQAMSNYSEVPIGAHHYLGSREAFFCRDDARMGSWRHSVKKWTARSTMREGGADDQVRPWIKGFVDQVGEAMAKILLADAGVLQNCTDLDLNSTVPAT